MKMYKTFYSLHDWGGDGSTTGLLSRAGYVAVPSVDLADIIVFNGGEDIGTSIYGEKPIMRGIPEKPSWRDKEEMGIFGDFQGKFFLGICRGSQFLNVLNGGTLWQDVDNHTRVHKMLDVRTGEKIWITSTHHQQMRPNLATGRVLGVAHECSIKRADGITLRPNFGDHIDVDTEVVWYPGTRTLCIQGHPEYVPGSPFAKYSLNLLQKCYDETS
jgi:hypothetical protein